MAGQPNKRRKVQRLTDWANARYSVMPADAARDPNLTLAHMRLLGELGRVNTQHGWCEFSQKDVAAQMGGVRQTVSAAMNDLVRWRYVEMRDQKQTRSPFCHYRVLIDDPYFEAEAEYIERHGHDPDDVSVTDDIPDDEDVSSGDDTPHQKDVSPRDDTPQTGGVVRGRHTCRLETTPPINRNARAFRSEINNPPTPRKRGKRESGSLLQELREEKPDCVRAIDKLIAPLLARLRYNAPSKVFSLGTTVVWAEQHSDGVLVDALRFLTEPGPHYRRVNFKPSDLDDAIRDAIKVEKARTASRNNKLLFRGTPEFDAALDALAKRDPKWARTLRSRDFIPRSEVDATLKQNGNGEHAQ